MSDAESLSNVRCAAPKSPKRTNEPRVPNEQTQRDHVQKDSDADVFMQHLFNFLAEKGMSYWCPVIRLGKNVRNVTVNSSLPRFRKESGRQVSLEHRQRNQQSKYDGPFHSFSCHGKRV